MTSWTFAWDAAKSERNRRDRDLPFELVTLLFQSPLDEREDTRRDYGERRMRAVGIVGDLILHCVYTDRDGVRRIISLRRANRNERDAYRAMHPR
jgi:uncharacterized DUF497 family protein